MILRLVLLSGIALRCCACLGQASPQQAAPPDVQQRAEAMLDKARHLSDIRSAGAPPFVLKATFSFVGDDLNTVEGTYTETWFSESRWRREVVAGGLRYSEIVSAERQWLVYPEGFPRQAMGLPSALSMLPRSFSGFNFSEITEQNASGVVAECALTKPNEVDLRTAFCFEKQIGVLLQKNVPERRVRNIVDLACEYGGFHKFGDYIVPYEMICFEDRHKIISANVVELSPEPNMDPALFVPPADAIELSHCTGKAAPPAFLSSQLGNSTGLLMRGLDPQNIAWAEVWFVVDTKGKPQDLRVVRSAAKGSPKRALNLVHGWRFGPGKCDGKPVPMPLTVEVPFNP